MPANQGIVCSRPKCPRKRSLNTHAHLGAYGSAHIFAHPIVKRARAENHSMRFEDVSMERSKSFVTALQELKNLRPQLYSAAEYCEKSYLHSEQKQMVLDNLKDYAVRALVNAIDHLGTVAYKLSDILEQQTLDVSSMELKVTCLNQLDSVNKKVHFSPHIQTDHRKPLQARARLYPSDVEVNARMKSAPASTVAMQTLGVARGDSLEGSKPMTPFRSFGNPTQREIVRPPVRSKSVLSAFFVKQKTQKLKSSA
ncbi:hypothetical protein DH2020_025193 [Rehmannia glutinosa]|uniref:Protein ABIL1 n=1 Tax=Rehmannia glutinosa TaxID=99300 RepID=A0ABR0W316_REHGL